MAEVKLEGSQNPFLAQVAQNNAAKQQAVLKSMLNGQSDLKLEDTKEPSSEADTQEATPIPSEPIEDGNNLAPSIDSDDSQETPELVEDPTTTADSANKRKYKSKEENLKALRDANKHKQAEIEELKQKLEKIMEHESVVQELSKRDERIKELQAYEDLMGLYKTEGFKEKYYDGVDNLINQAGVIADDYEVDKEVIAKAVSITNRRDLNEFLGQYFDIVGLQDIRGYIIDAQNLVKERSVAESRPSEAKEELLNMLSESSRATAERTRETLKASMKRGWDSMMTIYSDADKGIDTFKKKVGDDQHETRRNSILNRAQNEYAKAMAVVADSGSKGLPDNLIKAMAARFQLSEAAGELSAENTILKKELATLREQLGVTNSFDRPLASGSNAGSTVSKADSKIDNLSSHIFQKAKDALSQNKI